MNEFHECFDNEFIEQRKAKDRKLILESVINHHEVITIKKNDFKKHPYSILNDRWERRVE